MFPKGKPTQALGLLLNVAAGAILLAFIFGHRSGAEAVDAHIYWVAAQHPASPYTSGSLPGDQDYHYAPPFAQVLVPFGGLPFEAFALGWLVLQITVLVVLVNPVVAAILLLVPPIGLVEELVVGNIHVLLAGAIVVSFRWPAVWAFPILTKVTPGIGLAWYAARFEWRPLMQAIVVTAAISAVSALLAPAAWGEWLGWVTSNPAVPPNPHQLLAWLPLFVRLPIGIAVVVAAARLDWRWLVPFAVWISLPVIWYNSPIVLAASIPLARRELHRAADIVWAWITVKRSTPVGRSA